MTNSLRLLLTLFPNIGKFMHKSFPLFLIIVFSAVFCFATEPDIKILSSTAKSLTVEFSPKNWDQTELKIDQKSYSRFTFHKYSPTTVVGEPELPGRIFTFGVPVNGSLSLSIIDSRYETIPNTNIAPVPSIVRSDLGYVEKYEPDPAAYSSNNAFPVELSQVEDPHIFRNQHIARVVIHPLQYFPSRQAVRKYTRIVFQINFTGQTTGATTNQRIAKDESWYQNLLVNYDQAKQWRIQKTRALKKAVKDPFEGDEWYKIIIATTGTETKEGFFKVSGTALSSAGIPLASLDPKTIQVFNNGGRELPQDVNASRPDSLIETPIIVVGGDDGKMDADDYILFYARSLDGMEYDQETGTLEHYIHHYSKENVIWLTHGKTTGKRITSRASSSQTGLVAETSFRDLVFIEEELTNFFKSGEEWLGASLSSTKNSQSYLFSMPGAIPQEETIVRAKVAAATSGTHTYNLTVNGNKVGTFTGTGISSYYRYSSKEVKTEGVLINGNNTVTVEYPMSSDNMFSYVDWVEVEYAKSFQAQNDQLIFNAPVKSGAALYQLTGFSNNNISVYDVTDLSNIQQISPLSTSGNIIQIADETNTLTSKRYVSLTASTYLPVTRIEKDQVANLRTERSVELIIITHDDFVQQAQELESVRENWNPSHQVLTEVVKISDVIDEFGWGIQDPAAIRDFLVYAEEHWNNPQYVLLLGDGHFDYKNNYKNNANSNLIIPYETASNSENDTRTTDDWFTYTKGSTNGMQMAIGRIPAQTVADAQAVIQKIINYETKPPYGEWRKTITILGDDELVSGGTGNETIHTQQAERLSENHIPSNLDVTKIYLMEYPAVRTASVSGVTKPQASEALLERINRGTLMLNFIGHGNEDLWTHENVLYGPTDFAKIQNGDKTAWWIAATCEFAYWDLPDKQSLAENIITAQGRGAVGMVSSARLAYSSPNAAFTYDFYDQLFQSYVETGLTQRIGDAVMIAKKSSSNRTNSEKYGVFGDPCMRLGAPRYKAIIDSITPDSIQALRKVSITGHIEKDSQLWSDYDGKIQLRAFDSRKDRTHTTELGLTVHYKMAGNSIFKGVAPVKDGQFSVEFIVPKDISYGGDDGKISLYFWNDDSEGTGVYENMIVGGTSVGLVDHEGPSMLLHFGNPDFAPGDFAPADPTLYVEIADTLSGVNIAGDIGHEITMTLDDDFANSKDVTEYFEYNEGSFTAGKVSYPLRDISAGEHTIQIKAWDNSNNSSIIESIFTVVSDEELAIRNPLNYPNPMKNETTFTFELSREAEVTLRIFTVAGRLIKKFEPVYGQIGYNVFPLEWDGTDDDGDKLANGVYLYKITAKSNQNGESKTVEEIQKLIVAN